MVSQNNILYIRAENQDMSRPKERSPKTNWKIELLKKAVWILQFISPKKAAEIVWDRFTKPGYPRFTVPQQEIIKQARTHTFKYLGNTIVSYRWGNSAQKVLLGHGWNSKAADFRKMIMALVQAGYQVESIDMKGHGASEGKRSSLPEFRDILKKYYVQHGPFHAVVGYSLGGLAASVMLAELSPAIQPKQFFMIAAPPYSRYFFEDVIKDLGYRSKVYEHMTQLIEKYFLEHIDYFDIRDKQMLLKEIELHLIYDEDDTTIPLFRGQEIYSAFPGAHFVQSSGLGHYRIISYHEIIQYLTEKLPQKERAPELISV